MKTVGKVLDLLEHLAAAGRPLSISELASLSGFNISTAHRLMQTLAHRSYVEQNPATRAYALGSRLLELGSAYSGSLDLVGAARPRLETLRDQIGETVHLSILRDRDAVEICTALGRKAVTVSRGTGRRDPAHCAATGKVLLAALSDGELDRLLALGPLLASTPRTVTDPDALRAELATIRASGFATDDEELNEDVCCVGVPVHNGQGRVVASLSFAMPKARFSPDRIPAWVEMLTDTSAQISRAVALSGVS